MRRLTHLRRNTPPPNSFKVPQTEVGTAPSSTVELEESVFLSRT